VASFNEIGLAKEIAKIAFETHALALSHHLNIYGIASKPELKKKSDFFATLW